MVEVLLAIVSFLFEITIYIVLAFIFPLRFMLSKKYRQEKRNHWEKKSYRKGIDITFGVIATILFIGAVVFWLSASMHKPINQSVIPIQNSKIIITSDKDGNPSIELDIDEKDVKEFVGKIRNKLNKE